MITVSGKDGQPRSGVEVCMPFASFHASFFLSVMCVVSVGSQEEMTRIAAGRVIALMAGRHSGRDWAVSQFPCKPVSADLLPCG